MTGCSTCIRPPGLVGFVCLDEAPSRMPTLANEKRRGFGFSLAG